VSRSPVSRGRVSRSSVSRVPGCRVIERRRPGFGGLRCCVPGRSRFGCRRRASRSHRWCGAVHCCPGFGGVRCCVPGRFRSGCRGRASRSHRWCGAVHCCPGFGGVRCCVPGRFRFGCRGRVSRSHSWCGVVHCCPGFGGVRCCVPGRFRFGCRRRASRSRGCRGTRRRRPGCCGPRDSGRSAGLTAGADRSVSELTICVPWAWCGKRRVLGIEDPRGTCRFQGEVSPGRSRDGRWDVRRRPDRQRTDQCGAPSASRSRRRWCGR
jgi:hypothetical protein